MTFLVYFPEKPSECDLPYWGTDLQMLLYNKVLYESEKFIFENEKNNLYTAIAMYSDVIKLINAGLTDTNIGLLFLVEKGREISKTLEVCLYKYTPEAIKIEIDFHELATPSIISIEEILNESVIKKFIRNNEIYFFTH